MPKLRLRHTCLLVLLIIAPGVVLRAAAVEVDVLDYNAIEPDIAAKTIKEASESSLFQPGMKWVYLQNTND